MHTLTAGLHACAWALLLTAAPLAAQPQSMLAWGKIIANPGGRVDWSNVKNLIVYDHIDTDNYYDVYTMNSDGSNSQCLTCGLAALPQQHIGNPAWHPSGNYIVFQAQDPSLTFPPDEQPNAWRYASPGWGVNNNLWLISSDASQIWQLTQIASGMATLHPVFTHGGTKLIWAEKIGLAGPAGQWTIKLANLVWTNSVPSLQNVQLIQPLGINIFYETHDFSPDDQTILFSAGNPAVSSLDIYSYNLTTAVLSNLTNTPNEYDEHAHYTPDGTKIVWASNRNITLQRNWFVPFLDYWIMNADGTNQQRVTYFNQSGYPEYFAQGIVAADFTFGPTSQWIISKLEITANNQYNEIEVVSMLKMKNPLAGTK